MSNANGSVLGGYNFLLSSLLQKGIDKKAYRHPKFEMLFLFDDNVITFFMKVLTTDLYKT